MARDAAFEETTKKLQEMMLKNLERMNNTPPEVIDQQVAAKEMLAAPITMEELEKIAAGDTSTEEEEKPAANPSVVAPPAGPVNILNKGKNNARKTQGRKGRRGGTGE